ncbi:hypothetical protein [Pseudoalteromonas luteoviolacea]|uniref:Pullulanase n=1 Tax=Pseudoalteromonas luteoviolacea (strain 2ta16) TaxID=1353533 RepID=V4HP88_PSEL2|nr:hypothetical protein [Pseudoalteromonas luteoviolacea]ESP91603.1 hypothetical protein PL2TA16_00155 [Pseudoalteromonas luteoviolacea 2ta16]KZN39216.1 hypothetical protein N483_19545 [Pseudoalteromonas luteoviolacea NCIMB 1944]
MRKLQKTIALSILGVLGLVGCTSPQISGQSSTQVSTPVAKMIDRPMYLRGDFSLWDAEEIYQLQPQGDGTYSVRARFMSLGKVYEFKIADGSWSQGYNCGYRFQSVLKLGQPQAADCHTIYNYFSFIPDKKGWFRITFDYREPKKPMVLIQRD